MIIILSRSLQLQFFDWLPQNLLARYGLVIVELFLLLGGAGRQPQLAIAEGGEKAFFDGTLEDTLLSLHYFLNLDLEISELGLETGLGGLFVRQGRGHSPIGVGIGDVFVG